MRHARILFFVSRPFLPLWCPYGAQVRPPSLPYLVGIFLCARSFPPRGAPCDHRRRPVHRSMRARPFKVEPAEGPRHDVHKVPNCHRPPNQFQRDKTKKESVQDAENDGVQIGPFQILYQTAGQILGLRGPYRRPALPPGA